MRYQRSSYVSAWSLRKLASKGRVYTPAAFWRVVSHDPTLAAGHRANRGGRARVWERRLDLSG